MTGTDRDMQAQAVDTVVRSFTEAELALTEIAGAIERFRAASTQLAEAAEHEAAVAQALRGATEASEAVASQLSGLVDGLAQATDALRAVKPERLWEHLTQVETDRKADTVSIKDDVSRAASSVGEHLTQLETDRKADTVSISDDLSRAQKSVQLVLRVSVAAVVVGLVGVVLLILLLTGALPAS